MYVLRVGWTMALNEGASIFIPLLFLVVTEIGAIARNLPLKRIADEELPPFWIGVFYWLHSDPNERVRIPQLGRFNFIHGANLAIITLGFILVTDTTSGFTGHVVALLTWIVWMMLPIFEVDEYEAILETGRPVSFYFHVLVGSANALFIYFFDGVLDAFSVPSSTATAVAFFIGNVVLYYASLYGFLVLLKQELDKYLEREGKVADITSSEAGA